jgi:hypothetical protein
MRLRGWQTFKNYLASGSQNKNPANFAGLLFETPIVE